MKTLDGVPAHGQNVYKGDVIAQVGNTGGSDNPHLHYSELRANTPVNRNPRATTTNFFEHDYAVDPDVESDHGPSGVYHNAGQDLGIIHRTDRFYPRDLSAPLYDSSKFTKNTFSTAALVEETPLYKNPDALSGSPLRQPEPPAPTPVPLPRPRPQRFGLGDDSAPATDPGYRDASSDLIRHAYRRTGEELDRIASGHAARFGEDAMGRMASLADAYAKDTGGATSPVFDDHVRGLLDLAADHPDEINAIPGAAYPALRARFEQDVRDAGSDPHLVKALRGLQDVVNHAFTQSILEEDRDAWSEMLLGHRAARTAIDGAIGAPAFGPPAPFGVTQPFGIGQAFGDGKSEDGMAEGDAAAPWPPRWRGV